MSEQKELVCHLTTVHLRNDSRIAGKQCLTLGSRLPQLVQLVVADGLGSEEKAEYSVKDLGLIGQSRMHRFVLGFWNALVYFRRCRPTIVHFHDPELIPVALALKLLGVRIIYDVHEDLPRQVNAKYWIPRPFRRIVAGLVTAVEWAGSKAFDGIVTVTPTIAARFPNHKTSIVANFPRLSELNRTESAPYAKRSPRFAYVGGITVSRGAIEMVNAISRLPAIADAELHLAGRFSPASFQFQLENEVAWDRVNYHGWADRDQVAKILGGARAGLVVLHPIDNYPDAYPVKMFEYMSTGLPVIASDFPLWRQIVEDAACGILVDPLDSKSIADAMQWVLDNPLEAEAMGKRGREAVEARYNWDSQAAVLLNLYGRLLNSPVS
jgi:glycosyltransferase involved in cell wall biosynthesis